MGILPGSGPLGSGPTGPGSGFSVMPLESVSIHDKAEILQQTFRRSFRGNDILITTFA